MADIYQRQGDRMRPKVATRVRPINGEATLIGNGRSLGQTPSVKATTVVLDLARRADISSIKRGHCAQFEPLAEPLTRRVTEATRCPSCLTWGGRIG